MWATGELPRRAAVYRAEKILDVDDATLLAIRPYARALEVVRYLRHAFHYYRHPASVMSLRKLSEVCASLPRMWRAR